MYKKLLNNIKGFNLLNDTSIIFIYQYNNLSAKNQHLLKNQLREIKGLKSLIIKNKIVQKTSKKLESNFIELNNLFQGPTLLLGFNSLEQFILVKDIMKKHPNFLFVGGLYKNYIITQSTLNKIEALIHKEKTYSCFFTRNKLNYTNYTLLHLIKIIEYKTFLFFALKNSINSKFLNLFNNQFKI